MLVNFGGKLLLEERKSFFLARLFFTFLKNLLVDMFSNNRYNTVFVYYSFEK